MYLTMQAAPVRCTQACTHCHVESSPRRKEAMDAATAAQCVALMRSSKDITTVDLTGGAPELNDQFRCVLCSVLVCI